ncbi:MAG TPA: hypothetical protein VGM54_04090 [Chthoniobacter sp.]|jgi:hypothetical protein
MTQSYLRRSRWGLLLKALLGGTFAFGLMMAAANAQITTVFYILLENRCFTSGTDKTQSNILFQNQLGGSPYITSLCTPGGLNTVTGQVNPATAQSSFCSAYHNDLSSQTGNSNGDTPGTGNTSSNSTFVPSNGTGIAGSVHPSEPQYVWMEAGSNLSKYDDNDPYGTNQSVAQIQYFLAHNPSFSGENLSGLLQNAGVSWTSYTEGTCLLNTANQDFNVNQGTLTNNPAPIGVRTVPLASFSNSSSSYVNAYNGTHQYNFAAKHTGSLFFPATNGTNATSTVANTSPTNGEVLHYEPLESMLGDLSTNSQAAYVVITPDQYNDGHTALPSTIFTYNGTQYGTGKTGSTDLERVAQMDSFCSLIVPQIMASPVYQAGHAAIVIWTDETEGSPVQDDFYHTLTEIVISPYCKGNAYNSTLNYDHSADVATMQKVFQVTANTPTGYLNNASNPSNPTTLGTATTNTGQGLQLATNAPFFGWGTGTAQDLSDLFVSGTIPSSIPTVTITPSVYAVNARAHTVTQTVTLTNTLSGAISNPVYLVLGNLSANTSLQSVTPTATIGTSSTVMPGSPYINAAPSGLASGASVTVTLHYAYPSSGTITDDLTTVSNGTTP